MYANLGIMGFVVTSILFEISLSLNMGFDYFLDRSEYNDLFM